MSWVDEYKNNLPPEFAKPILGIGTYEQLFSKVTGELQLGGTGMNVTGHNLNDILYLAGQLGMTIKRDVFEGSPPGGSIFLRIPEGTTPEEFLSKLPAPSPQDPL